MKLIHEKLGRETFAKIIDDQSNELQWSPLLLAASSNQYEISRFLIDNKARLLRPMKSGVTLFHLAASNNDIHTIDYAL